MLVVTPERTSVPANFVGAVAVPKMLLYLMLPIAKPTQFATPVMVQSTAQPAAVVTLLVVQPERPPQKAFDEPALMLP